VERRVVRATAMPQPAELARQARHWLDVDPTNDLVPSDQHVTVAWGRDCGDVIPLRGVVLGGGEHTMTVAVDVSPLT